MTGPRHLWSGDWEKESVDPAANQPQPAQSGPEQAQQPQPPEGRGPRRGWRLGGPQIAALAAAFLIVAGVAVGLTVALDGNSSKPATRSTSSIPTSTRTQSYSVPGQTTSPTQPQTAPQTQPQTVPQTQTQTSTGSQTSTIPDLPSINWLGMQIITGPSGAEVTEVGTGAGDADGFQPEDVISTVDGKSVSTALQIDKIAASLPLGQQIPITVLRGGSVVKMAVTMKERPTVNP